MSATRVAALLPNGAFPTTTKQGQTTFLLQLPEKNRGLSLITAALATRKLTLCYNGEIF
jgi:hypothetical protein